MASRRHGGTRLLAHVTVRIPRSKRAVRAITVETNAEPNKIKMEPNSSPPGVGTGSSGSQISVVWFLERGNMVIAETQHS